MRISLKNFPSFILCLAIVLYISSYSGIFAGVKGMLYLSLALAAIIIFLVLTGFVQRSKLKNPLVWMVLFIYLLFSALFALTNSFNYIAAFLFASTLFIVGFSKKNIKLIFSLITIICFCLALSIFWQAFLPTSFYSFAQKWFYHSNQYENVWYQGTWSHQMSGIFYEVSFSAFFLSIGCLYCFSKIYFKQKRLLFSILLVSFYAAIYLTGKRSFLILVPAIILVMLLVASIKSKQTTRTIILIFLMFLAFPFLILLASSVITKGTGSIQLSSREQLWGLAVNSFFEKPILGFGINSFDSLLNASGIRDQQYSFAGAHNSYLQILCEIGIVGFLLYYGFIIGITVKSYKGMFLKNNLPEDIKLYLFASLMSIILILLYGFTGNPIHQPQQLGTLFLFLSFAMNLIHFKAGEVNIYENCLYFEKRV